MLIAATLLAGCNRAPKPFDFTFSGRKSAHGLVVIDQLSTDRTKGIAISSDLTPTFGDTWNSHDFFKAMREEGVITIQRAVPSLDPPISIKIYEFTNEVSGFHWYHGNYQSQASRCWEAVSGEITISMRRAHLSDSDIPAHEGISTGMLLSASASLSNVVFTHTQSHAKRRLDFLIITNVFVESYRL